MLNVWRLGFSHFKCETSKWTLSNKTTNYLGREKLEIEKGNTHPKMTFNIL
jgi:hypothetical protein